MTYVPESALSVLPEERPDAGSSDQAFAACLALRDVGDGVRSYHLGIAVAEQRLATMHSSATSVLAGRVQERLIPGATTLYQSASDGVTAMRRYASELEQIAASANTVVRDVEEQLAVIRACARAIEYIASCIRVSISCAWDSGAPGEMPQPQLAPGVEHLEEAQRGLAVQQLRSLHESSWRLAALQWQSAIEAVAAGRSTWQSLLQKRRSVERRLVHELQATSLGQLLTVRGGAGGGRLTLTASLLGTSRGTAKADFKTPAENPLLQQLLGATPAADVWQTNTDPTMVARQWAMLSEAQQRRLVAEAPWVIGNLPGLPYSVRDTANRRLLAYYALNRSNLSARGRQTLDEIMRILSEEDGKPPVMVVSLDLGTAVPRVSIGYGDLDTAQHLTWEVPGMLNDADQGLAGWNEASRNLHVKQLERLADHGVSAGTVGVIAYLEYDTPHVFTVLSASSARDAAAHLASELDGSHATREANTPVLTRSVLAHSYGTPVASNALLLTQHEVTTFTMIGSAGLDPARVSALEHLNVSRDRAGAPSVYTTMSRNDRLAPIGSNLSGRLQPNPQYAMSRGLSIGGGYAFSSDGSGDLKATTGHSILRGDGQGYMDVQTESLYSAAALTLNLPELVSGGLAPTQQRPATPYEQSGLMSGGEKS